MTYSYITIATHASQQIIEKKSRFIADVFPIETEAEALAHLENIRKEHWNASHHVFAYQIGIKNPIQRMSDDGEPSGTGGMPVLDVLRNLNITNTLVIVTRYFGGTLLGTGGLARAYGKAAKEAIAAAGLVKKTPHRKFIAQLDYTLTGKLQHEIALKNYIIQHTAYTEKVEFTILVPAEQEHRFPQWMADFTAGTAIVEKKGMAYVSTPHSFAINEK